MSIIYSRELKQGPTYFTLNAHVSDGRNPISFAIKIYSGGTNGGAYLDSTTMMNVGTARALAAALIACADALDAAKEAA